MVSLLPAARCTRVTSPTRTPPGLWQRREVCPGRGLGEPSPGGWEDSMGQTPGRGEYFLVRGPADCSWTPVSHTRMSRCRTTPVSPALRPRRHPRLQAPWACARGIGFVFASRVHPHRPWRARPCILASATCVVSESRSAVQPACAIGYSFFLFSQIVTRITECSAISP